MQLIYYIEMAGRIFSMKGKSPVTSSYTLLTLLLTSLAVDVQNALAIQDLSADVMANRHIIESNSKAIASNAKAIEGNAKGIEILVAFITEQERRDAKQNERLKEHDKVLQEHKERLEKLEKAKKKAKSETSKEDK